MSAFVTYTMQCSMHYVVHTLTATLPGTPVLLDITTVIKPVRKQNDADMYRSRASRELLTLAIRQNHSEILNTAD